MATRYWLGKATAVAQVSTAEFATYDVATTRTITIGGVAISAADSGGTLTAALTALAVLLNASTHPYFAAITWTSNATKIIGTAKTAGCPFTFAGSVSGGTGTDERLHDDDGEQRAKRVGRRGQLVGRDRPGGRGHGHHRERPEHLLEPHAVGYPKAIPEASERSEPVILGILE